MAGVSAHDTQHRIIELIPDKKIVWLVTSGNLSFLKEPNEWTNTRFCFELSASDEGHKITFTHEGLQPEIECYDACSSAWMLYLKKLEEKLK